MQNPFLVPIDYAFRIGGNSIVLVMPYLEECEEFGTQQEMINYVNGVMGSDKCCTEAGGYILFWDGLLIGAWKDCCREYKGMNFIADYGESSIYRFKSYNEHGHDFSYFYRKDSQSFWDIACGENKRR